ncbi:MAG: HEAT repeat domain-containing protein [Candidatus Hydrogenedentes bacterium]|nr:HEAT repeat domain-containing protein [Candidatus Hydrogenedentota bacterium]
MTMKSKIAYSLAALLLASGATADTVMLKNGIAIDGTVTKVNANCVAVRSGNGEIIYQTDEIDRIEENDKKGTLDLARANPAALQHEKTLEELTGLNADQREKVIAVVDKFAAEDANERKQAINQLIGMQQKFDVFRFLNESRQGFGARVLPGVLEVMLAIDSARTKPIVMETLTNQVATLRAAALELLGRHRELASAETIARGTADADIEVQIAAINALAQSGDRRATPVLLDMLMKTNPRLQNAGKAALSRIWSTKDAPVALETPDQWIAFWAQSSATVSRAIEVASLEPLYVQPPGTYVLAHE